MVIMFLSLFLLSTLFSSNDYYDEKPYKNEDWYNFIFILNSQGLQWRGITDEIFYRRVINTNQETIQKIYQLAKDMDELLRKHNIPYWMDGGSLIGALRNNPPGFIKWDDDLDWDIHITNAGKVKRLQKEIESLGYRYKRAFFGAKILCSDGYPFLDIFNMEIKDDKIYYRGWPWRTRDGEPAFYHLHELFPLKEYEFGPLKLFAANNPFPFVSSYYGQDWNTHALKYNHHFKKKERMKLSEEDRQPALPYKPLLDRVKKSNSID